jgi:hypothetical protein
LVNSDAARAVDAYDLRRAATAAFQPVSAAAGGSAAIVAPPAFHEADKEAAAARHVAAVLDADTSAHKQHDSIETRVARLCFAPAGSNYPPASEYLDPILHPYAEPAHMAAVVDLLVPAATKAENVSTGNGRRRERDGCPTLPHCEMLDFHVDPLAAAAAQHAQLVAVINGKGGSGGAEASKSTSAAESRLRTFRSLQRFVWRVSLPLRAQVVALRGAGASADSRGVSLPAALEAEIAGVRAAVGSMRAVGAAVEAADAATYHDHVAPAIKHAEALVAGLA